MKLFLKMEPALLLRLSLAWRHCYWLVLLLDSLCHSPFQEACGSQDVNHLRAALRETGTPLKGKENKYVLLIFATELNNLPRLLRFPNAVMAADFLDDNSDGLLLALRQAAANMKVEAAVARRERVAACSAITVKCFTLLLASHVVAGFS